MKSQRGFTLIEIALTTFIIGFATAVAGALILYNYYESRRTEAKLEAEDTLMRAVAALTEAVSQAVDVSSTAASINGYSSGTTAGRIRLFNGSSMGTPGQMTALAIFNRETGGRGTSTQSVWTPTAVFYQAPSPTRSGVIFISTSSPLSPSYDGLYYDRIVGAEVLNPIVSESGILAAIQFRLTMRYFTSPDQSKWIWCPVADITGGTAGCTLADMSPYADITHDFRVDLWNNTLGATPRGGTRLERALGFTHVFPLVSPPL